MQSWSALEMGSPFSSSKKSYTLSLVAPLDLLDESFAAELFFGGQELDFQNLQFGNSCSRKRALGPLADTRAASVRKDAVRSARSCLRP